MTARIASSLVLVLIALGIPALAQPPPDNEAISVALRRVAGGLTAPVVMAVPPDGSGRRFIADQSGVVRIVTRDGRLLDEPFLDVRNRMVQLREDFDERGLLGLAFHPEYDTEGRFYVYYSAPLRDGAPAGWDHTSVIAEFRVSPESADRADPGSERIVLRVDQPQFNHNGGAIGFGRDGFLYVALGDGGNANDRGLGHPPPGNGQDTSTLLGSILRIDVTGGEPYRIPPDNPFADGDGGLPEIYAYGFRNPYGMSFDAEDGRLFAADAGQFLWEEVSIVERGGNYGWNIKEGTHCFDPDRPQESSPSCPDVGPRGERLIDPVIEVPRTEEYGITIVRGSTYRGSALPDLAGRYVVPMWSGDFRQPSGALFVATPPEGGRGLWTLAPLRVETPLDGAEAGHLGRFILAVGQDAERELYLLTSKSTAPAGSTGEIFQLVPAGDAGPGARVPLLWIAAAAAALLLVAAIAARRAAPARR